MTIRAILDSTGWLEVIRVTDVQTMSEAQERTFGFRNQDQTILLAVEDGQMRYELEKSTTD